MSKKSKNNAKNKKIQSIKNKLVNGELIKNEDALYINNPDYFLTFSDLEISDGIDIIENIMVLSDNYISFNRENDGCLFGDDQDKMLYEDESLECMLIGNPRSHGHAIISTKKHFKDMIEIKILM